nr:FMN-binding protein [Enterococcus faecalis]
GCAKFGFPGYMTSKQAFINDTNQYLKKGLIVKADTIEELAKKLHLPEETLVKTVKKQNQNYIDHIDHEFGKEFYRMSPINQKPYYGCILGGRILG